MIELKSKGWAVFGLRGSGKSWFVKHILDSTPDHLIYDPLKEHRGYNRIEPKPTRMPGAVRDLVDFGRHWSISFGIVARKPVQCNTDLVELSDHVFFFQLPGKNDHTYLESLHSGLGDTVRNLPAHHFVSFSHGSEITVHAPIEPPRHPNET
jgi:hypothetical protein